jgi:glycerol dehydrogenase
VAAAGAANMRGGRSTLAALELARLCRDVVFEHGAAALAACRHRVVDDPFERVVEAATLLSGLGFESAGLAAAHAVHNGLTAIHTTHGMLHGEKVAFGTLVHLMLEAQQSPGAAVRAEAEAEARRIAGFLIGVGLPVTLGELGVDAADAHAIAAVAERATAPGETIHAMPFPVDTAGVVTALAAADAMGRAARGNQPS